MHCMSATTCISCVKTTFKIKRSSITSVKLILKFYKEGSRGEITVISCLKAGLTLYLFLFIQHLAQNNFIVKFLTL